MEGVEIYLDPFFLYEVIYCNLIERFSRIISPNEYCGC